MPKFHTQSFGLGFISGLVVLIIVIGGFRLVTGQRRTGFGGGGGGMNIARMADRMGISEDALQKELDSGKTMQQIAEEHGVQFGGGRSGGGNRSSVSSTVTGSGSSSLSSLSSSSMQ